MHRHSKIFPFQAAFHGALLAAALLFAPAAFAGPPLLCDPFDTAGAPSLPWGGAGWNVRHRGYDLRRLDADVQALLTPQTPVIARMEILRRAAIYASADGAVARALAAQFEARVVAESDGHASDGHAPDGQAKALALFDAGYFAETLQEILRLQGYDMPGIGKVDTAALRAILARGDGSARIARAVALLPDDASLRFASALVSSADHRRADYAVDARLARAGAGRDRLLARNIAKIAD